MLTSVKKGLSTWSPFFNVTYQVKRNLKVRFPRKKPDLYELERRQYKKLLHDYRLKNIQNQITRQTEVENKFIGNSILDRNPLKPIFSSFYR